MELLLSLGIGYDYKEHLVGTIEVEKRFNNISIEYFHSSSLENGLYREDSDTNVIYIKYDFR